MSSKGTSWSICVGWLSCSLVIALVSMYIPSAHAETLWVTDMLQLELYANSDMSGRPIKKLRSGDALDVIERGSRYAKVRTEDGTQGWVKSLYLVDKEPARTRVNKLEDANTSLGETVTNLRSQLEQERGRVKELQQQHLGTEGQKAATIEELEFLRVQNTDMMAQLSAYSSSIPISWMLLLLVLSAGGGFAGGWYWFDSRSRAKHGGYRVY